MHSFQGSDCFLFPIKLTEVEQMLIGKVPSAELAKEAGELAVKDTHPMSKNEYKVFIAKAMIERLVENMK